jgi:hypothetical protein
VLRFRLVLADYGVERSVPLDGLTAHEIDVKLEELVSKGVPER